MARRQPTTPDALALAGRVPLGLFLQAGFDPMHRRVSAVSAAIFGIVVIAACQHDVAERCEAFPVFFSVETRDYEVVGREEPGGRRWYTLKDKAGQVVAPCIPERTIRDRYPDAAAALERVKRAWKTPQLGYVD